jgi:hypothetical protein
VLAYLFWHAPRGDDAARYRAGLVAFHSALAADPPAGFAGSWTLRVPAVDWLPPAEAHYLDWYVVDDFGALGALNDAAVSGTRQSPHDTVAAMARTGTGGVVRQLESTGAMVDLASEVVLALLDKPQGTSYADFNAALVHAAAGASCWMRQMTLGPGPEYLVLGHADAPALPWPARRLPAVTIAP